MRQIAKYILFFFSIFFSCSEKNSDEDISIKESQTSKIQFFVLGDWGFHGSTGQMKVKYAMNKLASSITLNYIISVGDNFYNEGVTSTSDSLWYLNYERVYNDSSLLVPWYVVLGNHDHYGNAEAQVEYSSKSNYWRMPAKYYSLTQQINDSTGLKILFLDTHELIESFKNEGRDTLVFQKNAQYSWLKNQLSENKQKWLLVVAHHVVFSGSLFDGDIEEMKVLLKPLFDQYKVDFFICGHDHDFEHTKDKNNYTDYVISGSGGVADPANYNERTIYTISTLGFTYFMVNVHEISFYFIDVTGKVLYSYSKSK